MYMKHLNFSIYYACMCMCVCAALLDTNVFTARGATTEKLDHKYKHT